MPKRVLLFVLALLSVCLAASKAWAEERFALVIGNAQYQAASALANPARDAAAVSKFLKTAGFDVTTGLDLGQADLRQAVSRFAQKVSASGEDAVSLVYFAGHGIQIDGANYLLPVDVNLKRAADVPLQAVRLSDVMDTINSIPSKTRIVILDACRNNPFEAAIAGAERGLARIDNTSAFAVQSDATSKSFAGTGSVPKGLAVVTAPPGSLVVYSTSPGATAADGRGSNSPFTAALVEAGKTPGAPIETVLRSIRLSVHKTSDGKQTPWEVTALTTPFSFFPGSESTEAAVEPQKSDDAWREELRAVSPERAYDLVVVQDNVTVYQIFLSLYGDTRFGTIIQELTDRRIEMFAWFDALTLDTAEAYEAFLELYPGSDLARTAERLAKRDRQRSLSAQNIPSVLNLVSEPVVEDAKNGLSAPVEIREVIKTVIKKVPGPVRIKEVIKTVVKEVPGPVRIKTVIREVPGPVRIKEVIKRVPGPVRIKEIIKKVPGPTRIKTVIKKVPGPVRIKTVIKKVPGPVRYKTVIKRVPGPVRIKTVVRRLPCRCRRIIK